MRFGMTRQVSTAPVASMQLGTTIQFLQGIDSGKVAAVDFDDWCLVLFTQLNLTLPVCGHTFHLFGRGNAAKRAILMGKATVIDRVELVPTSNVFGGGRINLFPGVFP